MPLNFLAGIWGTNSCPRALLCQLTRVPRPCKQFFKPAVHEASTQRGKPDSCPLSFWQWNHFFPLSQRLCLDTEPLQCSGEVSGLYEVATRHWNWSISLCEEVDLWTFKLQTVLWEERLNNFNFFFERKNKTPTNQRYLSPKTSFKSMPLSV